MLGHLGGFWHSSLKKKWSNLTLKEARWLSFGFMLVRISIYRNCNYWFQQPCPDSTVSLILHSNDMLSDVIIGIFAAQDNLGRKKCVSEIKTHLLFGMMPVCGAQVQFQPKDQYVIRGPARSAYVSQRIERTHNNECRGPLALRGSFWKFRMQRRYVKDFNTNYYAVNL